MARLLLTVENAVVIPGRGLALLPGVTFQPSEAFQAGDPLRLERPDGSNLECLLEGFVGIPPSRSPCFLLRGVSPSDVPVGTKIWSVHSQVREPLPQPAHPFPRRVRVRIHHSRAEGLAVNLRFGMARKNDYYYIAFLGPDGYVEIPDDELIRSFEAERKFFIMDYVHVRAAFTGRITAEVCRTQDVKRALVRAAARPATWPVVIQSGFMRRTDMATCVTLRATFALFFRDVHAPFRSQSRLFQHPRKVRKSNLESVPKVPLSRRRGELRQIASGADAQGDRRQQIIDRLGQHRAVGNMARLGGRGDVTAPGPRRFDPARRSRSCRVDG